MIFALQTGMIPTTIIEYENMISEVIRGYWRSKQVKKSKKFGISPRDAVFYIHSITIPISIIDYVILSSEIFRGQ